MSGRISGSRRVRFSRDQSLGTVCLPARTAPVRPPAWDRQEFVICTTITVFDSIVLGDYESGLTYPTPMSVRDPAADPRGIRFVYRVGPEPGQVYRIAGS